MIESEFKYQINSEEYARFLQMGDNSFREKMVLQINYYFDTDQFELEQHGITLRIRQKEDDLRLELKIPLMRDGALRVKQEFSRKINKLPSVMNFKDDEWRELLPFNRDMHLKGTLVTQRTKIIPEDGIEIGVDKNYYLGLMDYELEVEFQEDRKERALWFIKNWSGDGKMLKPSQYGKKKRFFKALQELSVNSK